MPEGDTIWRVAARLRPALLGRSLRRFEAPRLVGPRPRAGADGTTVQAVEAVGKHLLIRFADGVQLQTHLRMTGSWHLYRIGERWQRPAHQLRVRLDTDDWVAVCFAAPVVRTDRFNPSVEVAIDRSPPVAHLGPDLAGADVDIDGVLRRVDAQPVERPVLDVLLDQRVAAGIGNVYKNELLWLHRLAPTTPIGAIDPARRRALYADAHRLLRANLGPGPRVTAPGVPGGVAVYGRRGRACPRCHSPIRSARLGQPPRSTYWCPTCQAYPAAC
ncbi:MAG: Fpg/Nei family DNA glycosylase [Acidimicrobiia bacterium]